MKKLTASIVSASLMLSGCATTKNGKANEIVLGGVAALGVATGAYLLLSNHIEAAKLTHYDAGDPTPSNNTADPNIWRTQTVVWGVDRSQGMPVHPSPMPAGQSGEWYFDFPACGVGHVDYVTFTHGPWTTSIHIRYRIEMSPGASLRPWSNLQMISLLTPYFQRQGDNWTGTGQFETYRWYDSQLTKQDLQAGEGEFNASVNDRWTAIETSSNVTAPAAFQAALQNAQAMGIVFGGDTGLGHGMCVKDGTARFVMEEYTAQ